MYEPFYELNAKPFQVSPDPEYIYWSKAHSMTIAMLRYGVLSASPLTVITGEVGAGKTTLLRQLLREFPSELAVGLVSNMQGGKGSLMEWTLMAFEQPYREMGHVERFEAFQHFVIETYATGKQVVLIIDEAQNLGVDQLEELRMLSNINSDADQLLQIILVGQPELRGVLQRDDMRQFAQRITSDFHLDTLQADEVKLYVDRRLEVAGAKWEIFPEETCRMVRHISRGVPRLINVVCDLALVYGYSGERKVIDPATLRELMEGVERNGIFNQFSPLSEMDKDNDGAERIPFPGGAAAPGRRGR